MRAIKSGVQGLILGLLVWGCASVPAGAPDWVASPPGVVGPDMVFVGYGTDEGGNAAAAEAAARSDLTAQVLQYMGVRVTNTTTATAKASLDSFKTSIEDVVKSESTAQVSGFRYGAKFQAKTGSGGVTVYLKGLYQRETLEAEKARLQKVFQETQDAVDKPAKEAAELVSSGKYFAALEKLIQGASASSTSTVDNAAIKFENYINKSRELLGQISIVALNPGQSTNVGKPFAEPFRFKVVYGTGDSAKPIPGASLRVAYKVKKNSRVTVAGATLKTDDQGLAAFTYPVPDFAARDNLVVILDINPYLDTLASVPRDKRDQVNSLEETAARGKALAAFTAVSNAKAVPLAVLVLDVAQDGTNLKKAETSAGITEVLTKAGFKLGALSALDSAFLKNSDDAEILAKLRAAAGPTVKRVVYGWAAISETEPGAKALARAGGSLKVVDLETGDILYSQTKNKRVIGSSADAAVTAAFHGLGGDFGTSLVDELP